MRADAALQQGYWQQLRLPEVVDLLTLIGGVASRSVVASPLVHFF